MHALYLVLFWHTRQIYFYFALYLLLCDSDKNQNYLIFTIISLCHLYHLILLTVALYSFILNNDSL